MYVSFWPQIYAGRESTQLKPTNRKSVHLVRLGEALSGRRPKAFCLQQWLGAVCAHQYPCCVCMWAQGKFIPKDFGILQVKLLLPAKMLLAVFTSIFLPQTPPTRPLNPSPLHQQDHDLCPVVVLSSCPVPANQLKPSSRQKQNLKTTTQPHSINPNIKFLAAMPSPAQQQNTPR